jgi:hypothetical protein
MKPATFRAAAYLRRYPTHTLRGRLINAKLGGLNGFHEVLRYYLER